MTIKVSGPGVVPGPLNLISDVDGIHVGNAEDMAVRSGVSVVLPEWPCTGGVDIRGGAPGTRETDLLNPTCLVDKVDAIVLSGGSVYGLDAASGVTAWLGSRGRGFRMSENSVPAPIVPAAILFDLANGGDKGWGMTPPYRALGIAACAAAAREFRLGNAGAGLGAGAGVYKGGLGSASAILKDGLLGADLQVGALVAANPFGSPVIPGSSTFWAAPLAMNNELGMQAPYRGTIDPSQMAGSKMEASPGGNTTICVVATNAILTKAQAQRVAIMAHDGFARAVRPVHTPLDGDVVFCLASGRAGFQGSEPLSLSLIGGIAADCVARALSRGVYEATSLAHMRSYRDTHNI
ncbi:MAG: peptidase S58 family protein [Alphaproteobacteria bacterium]|nr:peptidase S58 family protein [Alphaproteobacteria bacterium]